MQEKSFFQQVAYARRKSKRRKLTKKLLDICLAPAELDEVIDKLLDKRDYMLYMSNAKKQFYASKKQDKKLAMEVIMDE